MDDDERAVLLAGVPANRLADLAARRAPPGVSVQVFEVEPRDE